MWRSKQCDLFTGRLMLSLVFLFVAGSNSWSTAFLLTHFKEKSRQQQFSLVHVSCMLRYKAAVWQVDPKVAAKGHDKSAHRFPTLAINWCFSICASLRPASILLQVPRKHLEKLTAIFAAGRDRVCPTRGRLRARAERLLQEASEPAEHPHHSLDRQPD